MSSKEFEEVLDECLDMLRAGVSIDDYVARYPQYAAMSLSTLGLPVIELVPTAASRWQAQTP